MGPELPPRDLDYKGERGTRRPKSGLPKSGCSGPIFPLKRLRVRLENSKVPPSTPAPFPKEGPVLRPCVGPDFGMGLVRKEVQPSWSQ